ncbi:dual specificity protein phosphatase family protein [Candidatus Woesebacteria bacterium]|nr:dual specificity protein phosphatase family protein [Candidatus Woesebacteria bacterium]
MVNLPPRGRNDGHVFDYSQITDNIFIGSDLCKGNSCPVHGPEFEALGILVELNLSAERKEIPPDGIDIYSWLPVADGYAPTQEQMDIGTAIMDEAIKQGKRVYVHCKNGHGRSPTMVAAYLIRYQGKGVDEAIDFVAGARPEIHVEETQKEALNKFLERWLK